MICRFCGFEWIRNEISPPDVDSRRQAYNDLKTPTLSGFWGVMVILIMSMTSTLMMMMMMIKTWRQVERGKTLLLECEVRRLGQYVVLWRKGWELLIFEMKYHFVCCSSLLLPFPWSWLCHGWQPLVPEERYFIFLGEFRFNWDNLSPPRDGTVFMDPAKLK